MDEDEVMEVLTEGVGTADLIGIGCTRIGGHARQKTIGDEILNRRPTALTAGGILALQLEVDHVRLTVQHDIPLLGFMKHISISRPCPHRVYCTE